MNEHSYIQKYQKDGVKVGGRMCKQQNFADDQAMVANRNAGLHRTS